MGKKKSTGKHKTSSGTGRTIRHGQVLRRLEMKVKRWKRYQKEIEAGTRKGNASRWDVSGLQKAINQVKGANATGPKNRRAR